jgi:hypothetical protein
LKLFSFNQLIKTFTRITDKSATIIDHILCNTASKISQSGVIPVGLSDHFLIFCTRKTVRGQINKHKVIKIRSLKNYSAASFVSELSNLNWTEILSLQNVDDAWKQFKDIFTTILDKAAPIKEVRLKQRTEPWMNSEILHDIRERDNLLYKFNKDRSKKDLYGEYKKLRNKIQRDIKKAKSEYLLNELEANKNNSKQLWKHLKSLGYSEKRKGDGNTVLEIDGKLCFNPAKIAQHFNEFFTGIASNLVDKLPRSSNLFSVNSSPFQDYYGSKLNNSTKLSLGTVTEEFIEKELRGLNAFKSTGLDNIPARFLKDGASILKKPITHIVNLSITTSTVPIDFKIAKVKPLFKKNKQTDVSNYRPISILNIVSKVLEKAIYIQLENYLIQNNLLYDYQSGFRQSFSTDSCLIHLLDSIKCQSSRGLYTGMVMLDLQKAFDTVNHAILLDKLKAMGLESVEWFRSYLSERTQVVNIGKSLSEPLDVTCGVPQGSLLGPLLFLCYINDMEISVDSGCKLLLYADDSAILYSHKDPDVVAKKLECVLDSCNKWLVDNKLSLHPGKTECVIFGSRHKLKKVSNFSVQCTGHTISAQKSIKYLGIEIDQHLSGEEVAKHVICKANARLKFLYRQAKYLDHNCRKLLSSALIQCLFDYASCSWFSGLNAKFKNKLQTTQNKMVRFITNRGPRSHVGQKERSQIGYLSVDDRVKFLRLCHAHKVFYNTCAPYLHDNFVRVSAIHKYNTRSSSFNFRLPKVKGAALSTFFNCAIHDWNSLPNEIKKIKHLNQFKSAIKVHLVNSALSMEC